MIASIHRWVRTALADDYLKLGWVPQATLDGTTHGYWSVHFVWICPTCKPIEPTR